MSEYTLQDIHNRLTEASEYSSKVTDYGDTCVAWRAGFTNGLRHAAGIVESMIQTQETK